MKIVDRMFSRMKLWKISIIFGFIFSVLIYGIFLNGIFIKKYNPANLNLDQKKGILFSEEAFYFKFYEDLATTLDWKDEMRFLHSDDKVQYPDKIDAVNKYNLMPEIVLASIYRIANRISSIDVFNFYVTGSIVTMAFSAGLVFLISVETGGSFRSGIIAVFFLIMSYPLTTRVASHVALRENFGVPLLILQIFFLVRILKKKKKKKCDFWWYGVALIAHILVWQFSQFTLLAESLVLIFLYLIKLIDKRLLKNIIFINLIGLGISFLFFMWNFNLLNSLFLGLNISLLLTLYLPLNRIKNNYLNKLLFLILLVIFWGLYGLTSGDYFKGNMAHVFNYFNYQILNQPADFDSVLYKCSGAFNKINWQYIEPLFSNLLIPIGLIVFIFFIIKFKKRSYIWFLLLVTLAFFGFSLIARRFIVLAVPFMSVLASLILSEYFWGRILSKKKFLTRLSIFFCILVISINFSLRTSLRIIEQLKSNIYYPDNSLEDMDKWIKANTSENSVFAGEMQTVANISLITNRKVTNNPYYEDERIREKTWEISRLYGKETEKNYYNYLIKNRADFFILENDICENNDQICMVEDFYSLDDKNKNNPILCRIMTPKSDYFEMVYSNQKYKIFKISKE